MKLKPKSDGSSSSSSSSNSSSGGVGGEKDRGGGGALIIDPSPNTYTRICLHPSQLAPVYRPISLLFCWFWRNPKERWGETETKWNTHAFLGLLAELVALIVHSSARMSESCVIYYMCISEGRESASRRQLLSAECIWRCWNGAELNRGSGLCA